MVALSCDNIIPGMSGARIKENGRGGEFKYDIFDIL
jgi:hypothetical protein